MGFFDFLKEKKQQREDRTARLDAITDLTLMSMRPGFLVDHDLKTWEVTAANTYAWGDGETREWQLVCADDTLYLECETDDETEWSVSRPIRFRDLGNDVGRTIRETGDGPEEIVWKGETFYLEEAAGGHFHANGQVSRPSDDGVPLLQWSYENEAGDAYLTIEQWSDTEFQAFVGGPAHEYQFSNILPPAA